MQEAVT